MGEGKIPETTSPGKMFTTSRGAAGIGAEPHHIPASVLCNCLWAGSLEVGGRLKDGWPKEAAILGSLWGVLSSCMNIPSFFPRKAGGRPSL